MRWLEFCVFYCPVFGMSGKNSNFFLLICACRADSAAVAITTTDLVSKSVAVETKVCTYPLITITENLLN